MKNRDYKNFSIGEIYHVYNRGVNKEKIFLTQKDYNVFLQRLKENLFPHLVDNKKLLWSKRRRKILPPNSFDLIAYCLMPNHFHLLIQQKTELSITKLLSKICTSYSMCFNRVNKRVGTIFQDRFKAILIENNEQLLWTSYYIHKNPIEAKLVKDLNDYRWSSYKEYFNSDKNLFDKLCNKKIILEQFNSEEKYLKYFQDKEELIASFKDLYFDFEEE
ncbi:MAG: transposase [Candidatus Zambryskibacteria bacterium]|nr:transposase [Candidatus Zambryskibacteria bacterium]